jgi:hypothetical protein
MQRQPNKRNIRKWVQALRSGKFKQGTGGLCTQELSGDRKYCCLGVACEAAIADGLHLDVSSTNGRAYGYVHFNRNTTFLPDAVSDWLGLPSNGDVMVTDDWGAVSVNDAKGWSFNQIADALETRYLSEETEEPGDE